MLQLRELDLSRSGAKLKVGLARTQEEIAEAQRLRYRVFAEEMGARLPQNPDGIDCDRFDEHCDHLVVTEEESGQVVGTYRMLRGAQAQRIGGFYSEHEFDLSSLLHLRASTVELGRSCVHPEYRQGAVIALLWAGLADYFTATRFEYIIGCASLPMADGGHAAASTYLRLRETSMSPPEYRVYPRCALPIAGLDQHARPILPPLIKAYLRVGAWVCGDPAWDPDFNTADLLMFLPMSRLDMRYARHFMKAGAAS